MKLCISGLQVLLLLLGLLFFASSCKKDTTSLDPLDELLLDHLTTASQGVGKSYFLLPNSDEYSKIPQDPRNPITTTKVELGKMLFHETAIGRTPKDSLLGMEQYSCASCHHHKAGFQDKLRQAIGEGGIGFGHRGEGRRKNVAYPDEKVDVQPVRSPSILNVAYQEVSLWNGQFGSRGANRGTESRWTEGTPIATNHLGYAGPETQAIAGQTVHGLFLNEVFCFEFPTYDNYFNQVYPGKTPAEIMTLEHAGLAIAAYERTVLANQAPFQLWLRGKYDAMTNRQKEGAILFFSKAKCNSCHSGPALAINDFFAIGMKDLEGTDVISTQDAQKAAKGRGGFTGNPQDDYKFKVPQLYNLKDAGFLGHGSSFTSVFDVIAYKNQAVPENPNIPISALSPHFQPLGLSHYEMTALTDFIENALYDPDLARYAPTTLPTGYCFPNNDHQSRVDLGCL